MTAPTEEITQKLCVDCGDSKPLTEFGRDSRKNDETSRRCRKCAKERQTANLLRGQTETQKAQARRQDNTDRPRTNLSWQDAAACRGEDLELFFGPPEDHHGRESATEKEQRERQAKRICAACPVRAACLDHAVALPERYGIYGGETEDERFNTRRRRLRQAREGKAA